MSRLRAPSAWFETGLLGLALGLLAVVAYGHHVIHGGFLSDSWSLLAVYEFSPNPGPVGAVGAYLDVSVLQPRPLYAVYLSMLHAVFGSHMGYWLAWLSLLGVTMSLAIFVLLRQLNFSRLDAGSIVMLLLIFPGVTAIRLWTTMVQAPLSITLVALGFLAALRAFAAEGSKRIAWHAVSLALFVASLLLYEIALPVMLASWLVYRVNVPDARASRRWLVDCAVLLPIAAVVKLSASSPWPVHGVSSSMNHAETIFVDALRLFTTVVVPAGVGHWPTIVVACAIPVVAIAVLSRASVGDPTRAELRRWLRVALGGTILVVLGYLIFVPTFEFYSPMSLGLGNRVNAVPSIGWVLILYAGVRLVATMLFRDVAGRGALLASGFVSACVVAIGVSWLNSTWQQADTYERAYAEGERVLDAVTRVLPDPQSGSTIWTFGQPVEMSPGIHVFANTWEMTHSIQVRYDDPTMKSFVGYPGTAFRCGSRDVFPYGHPQYEGQDQHARRYLRSSYARTYFVDTTTGRVERIDTQARCRRAALRFPRSPAYPPQG